MQETPRTSDSIQRRRRRWGRDKGAGEPPPETESAPYIAAAALPQAGTLDRFRPPSLLPVEPGKTRRALPWVPGSPEKTAEKEQANPKSRIQNPKSLPPWRTLDKVLLAVEVVGALVVAWLLWQYVYTVYIDTAPRRVTPSRIATALPGGATLLTPTATARPSPTRFVEIAPPLVGTPEEGPEDAPPTPRPAVTPTPTVNVGALLPTRLRIPVMFLDSPVREVTVDMGEWQVSPMDIGHHEGTANPGEVGNVVLAAHRDINSALFRDLDRLAPGDDIYVSNALGEYHYTVTESFVVNPNDTAVMDPTGDKRLTLITCTPIGIDTQRLIVVAQLNEKGAGVLP